jgi:CRISPR-associated protein Cas5h
MNYNKILIFDTSSEYGHFRKFNTTTSPLTYSIPPRTAITGLLGAIIGLDRFSFYEVFSKQNANISVQVLNPVKKVNMAFNLLDTKKSFFDITNCTQIEFELLKDPKFRLFINISTEEIFNKLYDNLFNNKHHFSPYLGLSQFTAKVEFIDLTEGKEEKSEDFVDLITALNLKHCIGQDPIKFDYEAKYSSNVMAVYMKLDEQKDRIVTDYSDILIELDGRPIKAKVDNFISINKYGNIKYL